MSAADSIEQAVDLSPVVRSAAEGRLPDWARVSDTRREHIARVVGLLDEWSRALKLPEEDRTRWLAAGWLHDSLRDGSPDELRQHVSAEHRTLPPPLLHGPAAAALLENDADDELRDAIRYHTIGHPSLRLLGRSLYLADFLEPGRDFEREWTRQLRAAMPQDMDRVLREVVAARIRHLLEEGKPIRPETAAFWTSLVTRS